MQPETVEIIKEAVDFQSEVNQIMEDEDKQFAQNLLDYFPIEDGMPSDDDVYDFCENYWTASDVNDEQCALVIHRMDRIYPDNAVELW